MRWPRPRCAPDRAERTSPGRHLVAFALAAGACLAPLGCAKPGTPERGPTLAAVHADPAVLATAHPAWAEAETIRARLLEAGVDVPEPEFGQGPSRAAAGDVPTSAAAAHPAAATKQAGQSVHSGDADLADIVARGARPSPQLGGPAADAGDGAGEAAVAGDAALSRSRADEAAQGQADRVRMRRLEAAYEDALRSSSRGGVDAAERVRAEARLAASGDAAKARAVWEAEQARSSNPQLPEDTDREDESLPAPAEANAGPPTDPGRRLDELHHELERENARLDEFSTRTERAARNANASQPADSVAAESSAAPEFPASPVLEADRALLAQRYKELVERIESEVRAVAVSVGRSAGYAVRFDGSGPDRTGEVLRLLQRFYGEPGGSAQEKIADVADDR